jgi:hypothetical protein
MTNQAIALRETERKYELQPNTHPPDPSGLLGPTGQEPESPTPWIHCGERAGTRCDVESEIVTAVGAVLSICL